MGKFPQGLVPLLKLGRYCSQGLVTLLIWLVFLFMSLQSIIVLESEYFIHLYMQYIGIIIII